MSSVLLLSCPDQPGIVAATAQAIADSTYVLATTARARDLTKPVLDVAGAMAAARDRIAAGGRVAVLFGPERSGLENDDIARADAILSVPVNPDFPSLNLAQCVLLVSYEFRRQVEARAPRDVEMAGTEWANGTPDRLIKLTLNGLYGPIKVLGKDYPGQVPMTPYENLLDDEAMANVMTYVRNAFGNRASVISPEFVEKVRADVKASGKEGYYRAEELGMAAKK